MPRNNFHDDNVSVLTEGDAKSMFGSRSRSRRFMSGNSNSNSNSAPQSSSQSVGAASLPARSASSSFLGFRSRSRSRPRKKNTHGGAGSGSQSVSEGTSLSATIATSTPSLFGGRNRSRSHSRGRRHSMQAPANNTNGDSMAADERSPGSESATAAASTSRPKLSSTAATRSKSMRSLGTMKKRFSIANRSFRNNAPDDISVSDSLCSGVIRDAAALANSGNSMNSTARRGSVGPSSSNGSAPMPGGVADFNKNYNKKPTNESVNSILTASSGPEMQQSGSSRSFNNNSFASSNAMSSSANLMEDQMKREQRKERVKEKLDKYKRDQKQLKQACVAMEQQLAQTTEKLKEVDSKAASKIDSLELELRETRVGMEQVARQSTREVTDQSECIKTLGKKLIRQAHVIKRQKVAVEQYKIQLQGLGEEMAMQDERDQHRDEEVGELRDRLDIAKEQKIQMQNMLQENIEEMMDLKSETEKDAKNIRDLEFHLQQKEATLDRVAAEVSDKTKKISELEDQLEDKRRELDVMNAKYKESENSVTVMQKELENASSEVEELRCNYASWKKTSDSNSADGAAGGSIAGPSAAEAVPKRPAAQRQPSFLWNRQQSSTRNMSMSLEEGEDPVETFEAELTAKDATIQSLDDTCKEHEETIKTMRSDMVKMSSTYKQDSYLKRKEIAKLKQQNAEYALKLRALEKAFKCVNATGNMSVVGSKFHGHTSHGPEGSSRKSLDSSKTGGTSSLHGQTVHSVSSIQSKEEKAAAVKARLGLAPYEFPVSNITRSQDPLIVQQANFFDGASDGGSDLGGKGENPEEC